MFFTKKRLVRLPPLTSPILKIKQLNQTKKIITKKLKINTFYFLKIFLARNTLLKSKFKTAKCKM